MDTANPDARPQQSIEKRLERASHGEIITFDGLSVSSLQELGYSMDELYRLIAPRRTLARRIARGETLTAAENDRAQRLFRIARLADRVFQNADKARRWLRKSNRALDGVAPIDLLESETGAYLVEQSLHQIDHGIYV